MENNESDKVMAFDTLYTNNQIQILKIMLPYLERTQQGQFAVLIKFMELQHTMDCSSKKHYSMHSCEEPAAKLDPLLLLEEIRPYCSQADTQKLSQITGMLNTFSSIKEMMPMIQMMQEMTANSTEDSSDGMPDMSGMLKNMLSPEQAAMFEAFQGGML